MKIEFDLETLAKSLHQHSFWDNAKPWQAHNQSEELDEHSKNEWRKMARRFIVIYENGGRKNEG